MKSEPELQSDLTQHQNNDHNTISKYHGQVTVNTQTFSGFQIMGCKCLEIKFAGYMLSITKIDF